jgi:HAD superfamily hydrolase (TIGR01662 family)
LAMFERSPIRFVLFDWGDTLMKDDPAMTLPMARWPRVEAVPGAVEALTALTAAGLYLGLATGAEVSTEEEILYALGRVGLAQVISHVFCFKNCGLRKPTPGFYAHVLETLGARPEEAVMVGDSFEKDVAAAVRVGMRAVWFNPRTPEVREDVMFRTIHRLEELPNLLSRKNAFSFGTLPIE